MFEALLVRHCAPVLAGLKTANMFSCVSENCDIESKIESWKSELNEKGIGIDIIKQEKNNRLVYVYRKSKLAEELSDEKSVLFLKDYGYCYSNMNEAISQLKEKMKVCSFPHEIGVFLGYPLGDIKGFIENKGCNYKICGFWKVYCNEECTKRCFEKYKKCFRVYNKLYESGRNISDMLVKM